MSIGLSKYPSSICADPHSPPEHPEEVNFRYHNPNIDADITSIIEDDNIANNHDGQFGNILLVTKAIA